MVGIKLGINILLNSGVFLIYYVVVFLVGYIAVCFWVLCCCNY